MSEDGCFATLTLNRPHVHNALNDGIVRTIKSTLERLRGAEHSGLRAVFLKASGGKTFCGGGDMKDFKNSALDPPAENHAKAVDFAAFLAEVNTFPRPVVAMVDGPAFGGGVGIISVCDMAFSTEKALFTLSEVKLGLIPATISPYVVARIGEFHARRYFTTAEKFDAEEAKRIGLVHDVVADADALEQREAELRAAFAANSPAAMVAAKELVATVVGRRTTPELIEETAQALTDIRSSEEGIEGMTAFLEKRKASWLL